MGLKGQNLALQYWQELQEWLQGTEIMQEAQALSTA